MFGVDLGTRIRCTYSRYILSIYFVNKVHFRSTFKNNYCEITDKLRETNINRLQSNIKQQIFYYLKYTYSEKNGY